MRLARGLFRLILLILLLIIAAVAILKQTAPIAPPEPAPETQRVPLQGRIDSIVIEKAARRLTLYRGGDAVRSYPVALGFSPQGDKLRQGDGRTPEGVFRINRANAASRFHLSLGLDYPHADDVAAARAAGYAPGGDIMIHGQPNAFAGRPTIGYDWTAGCIALSDADMDEVWRVAAVGTPVVVRP